MTDDGKHTVEDPVHDDEQSAGHDTSKDQSEGQVSEVSAMDTAEADTPIAPHDSTGGYPTSESGEPDEGEQGPESVPEENQRDMQV